MATNGKVLVIPGFLGSHLDKDVKKGLQTRYWYSPPQIIQGRVSYLQLKADGVTPESQFAGPIIAKQLVGSTLLPLVKQLSDNWDVTLAPYDWRYSIAVIAAHLVQFATESFGTEPFWIVGYSFGGLIAREMYRQMSVIAPTPRIRRIVTIGAPHWGSYSAVGLFGRIDPTYLQLAVASAPASYTFTEAVIAAQSANPFGFLDKVTTTWPAVYHLFPNLAQPGVTNDPMRAQIYSQGNYIPFNSLVKAPWLQDAKAVLELLAGPSSIPAPDKIVCVRGLGVSTDAYLTKPLRLNSGAGYGEEDGDGRVTAASAMLASAAWDCYAAHEFLPSHPLLLAAIDGLLLNGLATPTTVVDNPGRYVSPGPSAPGQNQTVKVEIEPPPTPVNFSVSKVPQNLVPVVGNPEPAPVWCPNGPSPL